MGLGSLWCYVWWFVLGAFASWLAWWLIDRLFLRDTETPVRLAALEEEQEVSRATHAMQLAEIEELKIRAKGAAAQAVEMAQLHKELESRKDLEQIYETEYNKVANDRDAKARQLAASSSEAAKLRSDLAATAAEREASANEFTRLKSELAAAAAQTHDAGQLRAELAGVRSRFDASQQELAAATTRLAAHMPEVETLRQRLTASEVSYAETTNLHRDLELARETAATQKRDLERLKTEWSAASAHSAGAAKLQLDLETRDAQARRLEEEIATLKGVLLESKNALERQSAEIVRLKGELATVSRNGETSARLEADLAASRTSEGHLRTELATAAARIANLERLRLALDAARQAAAGHASEVARLNAEFHAHMQASGASASDKPDGGKS